MAEMTYHCCDCCGDNDLEWRHFFRLRTSPKAHPQMIEVASQMLADFRARVPVIFDNL
jgi:thymidylate synthase (FAD)